MTSAKRKMFASREMFKLSLALVLLMGHRLVSGGSYYDLAKMIAPLPSELEALEQRQLQLQRQQLIQQQQQSDSTSQENLRRYLLKGKPEMLGEMLNECPASTMLTTTCPPTPLNRSRSRRQHPEAAHGGVANPPAQPAP